MQAVLNKLLSIYLLGQLVNLPTLHSILEQRGIKSNFYQINYNRLVKNIAHQDFIDLFESGFKEIIKIKLKELSQKDPSIWSRELATVILDDSVFKHWIDNLLGVEKYYSSFFSGQYNSKLYGFKVLCLGISIDSVFHPLFFKLVPKKIANKQGKNTEENACKVAEALVQKWGLFVSEMTKEGFLLPKFHFSCDNGYSDAGLCKTCEDNNLIYISVPKKSHIFTINSESKKLADFIIDFEKQEKEYIKSKESNTGKLETDFQNKIPYIWRVSGEYKSQNKKVILLFFRLNNSKKISVIYSTDLQIFSKTLRRHWFNRTYIEQFFKLLKHSMKIQNTIIKSKEAFEKKISVFMFLGFYLQLFVHYARKQFNFGLKRKIGLEAIKRHIIFNQNVSQLLDDLLQTDKLSFCSLSES